MTVEVSKAKAPSAAVEVRRLLGLAQDIEPALRDAFLQMIDEQAARVDLDRVAGLLRQGQTRAAITEAQRAIASNADPLAVAIRDAVDRAGQAAADRLPFLGNDPFYFNQVRPEAVQFARGYGFDLVREMRASTREAVADAVRLGLADKLAPEAIARDVREAGMKLTRRQTQAVSNYRRMLRQLDPEALTRELRHKKFDKRFRAAIAEDKRLSQATIDTMTELYRSRMLIYRSNMIARTESMRAVNAGNRAAWVEAEAAGMVNADSIRRIWWHRHDSKVRSAHVMIPLMQESVGLNEPYESPLGPILYPGDPAAEAANVIHCRCRELIRYQPRL